MTTLEGNKLIAEFMGANFFTSPYGGEGYTFESTIIDMSKWKEIKDAKYHTSWDWLMPVVEKVESIHDPHHGYFAVHIVSNGCVIQATNFRPDKPIPRPPHYFTDWTAETKIDATWRAVVQFIQWYNNQNK